MKDQTPNYALLAYNLLNAAADLSNILGWSPDNRGFIEINFADVAEIIATMQQNAKIAADEIMFLAEEKGGGL